MNRLSLKAGSKDRLLPDRKAVALAGIEVKTQL
jgi:hypothetical protein